MLAIVSTLAGLAFEPRAPAICGIFTENTIVNQHRDDHDPPLPGTLTFVTVMGVCFLIAWFGLFVLLKERW